MEKIDADKLVNDKAVVRLGVFKNQFPKPILMHSTGFYLYESDTSILSLLMGYKVDSSSSNLSISIEAKREYLIKASIQQLRESKDEPLLKLFAQADRDAFDTFRIEANALLKENGFVNNFLTEAEFTDTSKDILHALRTTEIQP